jgi:hypothetical protein
MVQVPSKLIGGPEERFPSSSRDFYKVAEQRFTTAEFLFKNDYNLDAMYLAGVCC